MRTTSNKKSLSGVYILRNEKTGRVYIGSSADIITRIYSHFYVLEQNRHANKDLQRDYNNGDIIKPYYYKLYLVKNRKFLLSEEGKTIEHFKKNNISLYNKAKLNTIHFFEKRFLLKTMADLYCKEHYGRTFDQFTASFNEAQCSMYFEILNHPEDKEKIEESYQDIIEYINKERYFLRHPDKKRKAMQNYML